MKTSVKTAANRSHLTYGASRNKRKGGTLSFNDKRASAAQLEKLREMVGNNQAPLQFEKPKPLSEMVHDRIKGNSDQEKRSNVYVHSKVDQNKVLLKAFRSARDNDLGLNDTQGLLPRFALAAPQAIVLLKQVVTQAESNSNDENEQAATFKDRFNGMFGVNDDISHVAQYYYKKAKDKTAAKEYMKHLVHEKQNFNFNLNEEGIQYQAPKEGLFGPSQSSLDMATQIANRILREAFQSEDQEERFFKIATGVGAGLDSSNDTARVASKILEDYLKPKLMDFIYRLPLNEQMENDDVWEGDTLNSNVVDDEGAQLPQDDTWVRPKVQEAWQNIRNIVSPAVLNYTGKAGVKVDGLFGRAFYRTEEKMIHLNKITSSKATVMHEFGHHLENHSKVPHWIKLHQLMRDRSQGGELKRIFPFTIPYVISKDEMRYDTDLPSSGEMGGCFGYNVKYYPHGSTEVVSTAFEVFHNRDKAFRIAVKDPGLFLAVMGVLRGR